MRSSATISKSENKNSLAGISTPPVFFKPVQAKLSVNRPGDVHEQEADAMSEKVMRMTPGNFQSSFFASSTPPVQRKCAECEEEEKKLQRKEKNESAVSSSPEVDSYVNGIQAKGDSMSPQLRSFFEPRFGYDFSGVKMHTDTVAAKSAQSINALAYTSGNHIVFNNGQFSPQSEPGKKLLAHELTHVVQQSSSASGSVMRKCDPALFAGRTGPLFFPKEKTIVEIFQGSRTLKKNQSEPVAIGVIQQALADLSIDIGKNGPAKNGVDRDYGKDMAKGVEDFQTKNSLPPKGDEVDADTIKCLDQERMNSIPVVSSEIKSSDLAIKGEETSADQNIFFARGDKDVDAINDIPAIQELIKNNPGEEVTPQGFISEDELMEFGPKLAEDRAKNVLKELQREQTKLKLDPAKELKFKPAVGKPEDSIGVVNYLATRRVHMEITGKVAATGKSCATTPADWATDHSGPCDKGDNPSLETSKAKPAIDKAQKLLKKTLDDLKKKDANAKDAVETWFGSKGLIDTVISKVTIWKDHLDKNVPAKHRCADECHGACDGTDAYNHENGSSAMMTFCPGVLTKGNLEEEGLIIAHEAGHGALGTTDFAYDFSRLISVLQKDSTTALKNTDSYIFMIKCLNGILTPCVRPPILGDFTNLSASSDPQAEDKAKISMSWLERWTDLVWQDVNNLYSNVSKSHAEGKWPKDTDSLTLKTLNKHFGIARRASQESPANLGEQVFVGVMNTKLLRLKDQVADDAKFLLDKSPGASSSWDLTKSVQEVTLVEDFFKLGARAQVKTLLKLLLSATLDISTDLEDNYADFIDEQIKTWFVKP